MEAEDDEIVLKVSSSKPVPSQPRPETILELISRWRCTRRNSLSISTLNKIIEDIKNNSNTISLSELEATISDSDMNVIVQNDLESQQAVLFKGHQIIGFDSDVLLLQRVFPVEPGIIKAERITEKGC